MKLSDFDYELPKELIAQKPLEKRDDSRLLVVQRASGQIQDKTFSEITRYFEAGDVLVLNDTKVHKARVLGHKKETGGKVDALLLAEESGHVWRALLQPALKEGQAILFPGNVEARYAGRTQSGLALLEFSSGMDVRVWIQTHGEIPLPPYIKRNADASDEKTYQTVYAQKEGAVAAPTAGLHFTQELLDAIRQKGVEVLQVTLHVGYGTFRPVEDLENHRMHSEVFELSESVAEKINEAKSAKKKIWAVGTTTLRVLETCVVKKKVVAGKGETDLYIREPFKFEVVDHLITNFHLPKTTLLLLVSAFMGELLRKKAYEHALSHKYRFYSYGDAMLIL